MRSVWIVLTIGLLFFAAVPVTAHEYFMTEVAPTEGFEPHIISGPSHDDSGEWYYLDSPTGLASGDGGNLWISKDFGETWTYHDKDAVVGGSGDSYTAITKDGGLYYTDLYLSSASVDYTPDGGDTWFYNPLGSTYTVVDRQWLLVGPTPGSPGDETLYFAFNQLAIGLVMVRSELHDTTGVALDFVPVNNGLPISSNVGSRDYFNIDMNDGTLYIANWQSNGIYCYRSADAGDSWSSHLVTDVNTGHAEVQNTFMINVVDDVGNVYFLWSSREHIMLGVSTDGCDTWNIHQVTETNGTRVLPWIEAGGEGRIAMGYYETNESGNPNNLDEAEWDYRISTSFNALEPEPRFHTTVVEPEAHIGSVRTSGTDGDSGPAPDRDLGDYHTMWIDSYGRIITTFGNDYADGNVANSRESKTMFARQIDGPFMIEEAGPEANFSEESEGLEITVSASEVDFSNTSITSYFWDWGDGSNTTTNTSRASHTYSEPGHYDVRLRVTNEIQMRNAMTLRVTVDENDQFPLLGILASGAMLLILAIIAALLLTRSKVGLPGAAVSRGIDLDDGLDEPAADEATVVSDEKDPDAGESRSDLDED